MAPSRPPAQAPAMMAPADLDLEHGTPSSGRTSDDITAIPLRASKTAVSSVQPLDVLEPQPQPKLLARPRSWISTHTPAPLTRCCRKVTAWIKGPVPPRTHHITPFFERAQTYPSRLVARLPRGVRACVYAAACMLWVVLFGTIITQFGSSGNPIEDGGQGLGTPIKLSCVASMWYAYLEQMCSVLAVLKRLTCARPDSQSCGLDGRDCLPFDNGAFAFNCPAGCADAQVLNPRAIGGDVVSYRSLVIGGTPDADKVTPMYRGDSFICSAAIHAGVITDSGGGCGVLSLVGEKSSFGSVQRNGIQSIGVNASFPMAFTFSTSGDSCRDPRWNLLALSTVFSVLFSLFTTTAATFFAPIFTIVFFQIGMASDPPPFTDYASLASTTLGRFLPAALAMAFMYRFSVRKTLHGCTASTEKTILWLGGCWVGALANLTFERIPLQRLTTHDLHQQPGAITALIILVLVLFAVILYQAHTLRLESRLPRYLALYGLFGTALLLALAAPHLTLRIHHYIIALLLLPGTAIRTRPSLLAQGLLVGLFINGIARWGFDPVLQTVAALQGDAQVGSALPAISEPVLNGSSIAFSWADIPRGFDEVSVLVNDVERFRGRESGFAWERKGDEEVFFRFGFVAYRVAGGVLYGDLTRAGTWGAGGWSGIPEGRT
jgi:hypothetical protein